MMYVRSSTSFFICWYWSCKNCDHHGKLEFLIGLKF